MADTIKVVGNWKGQVFIFAELAAIIMAIGRDSAVVFLTLGVLAFVVDFGLRAWAARDLGRRALWHPYAGGHIAYLSVWIWGLVLCVDAWAATKSELRVPPLTMFGMVFMAVSQAIFKRVDGEHVE